MHVRKSVFRAAIIVCGCLAFAAVPAVAHAAPASSTSAAVTHFQTAVPDAARKTGADGRLSQWYQKDGVTYIGLTSVHSDDLSKLTSALGSTKVKIFTQSPFTTADKLTPVSKFPPVVYVATTPKGTTATGIRPQTLSPGYVPPFIDSTPYYGGDRIVSVQVIGGVNYVVQCTTTGQYPGGEMTAGHCGPSGTNWLQGYYDTTTGSIYNTGPMGTGSNVHWSNNDIDGQILTGGSYYPAVWEATSSTDYSAYLVAGGYQSQSSVCTDGSFTGYTCGAMVTVVDLCANITQDDGTVIHVCGLVEAQNTTKTIVQSGDSGGPVLTMDSTGKALIDGTISAQSDNGHTVLYTDVNQQRTVFGGPVRG